MLGKQQACESDFGPRMRDIPGGTLEVVHNMDLIAPLVTCDEEIRHGDRLKGFVLGTIGARRPNLRRSGPFLRVCSKHVILADLEVCVAARVWIGASLVTLGGFAAWRCTSSHAL